MVAILQPLIPHYRNEFFELLSKNVPIELYCFDKAKVVKKNFIPISEIDVNKVQSFKLGRFLFYNPLFFLKGEKEVLVLMLSITHLTTWFLLFTRRIHRKRIILWGHGISIKYYLKEEQKVSLLKKWMIKLADGIWFYTPNELNLWKKRLPNIKAVSLGNTISGMDQIRLFNQEKKNSLKSKYGISYNTNLIYCARFDKKRNIDLLLKTIRLLDEDNFGFIIIGNGTYKPDFSSFKNVFDFGSVYDRDTKNELFCISDIYFQPGWLGLSTVEALAYGKPVFSFKRTKQVLQCVEYGYVEHGINGMLFENVDQLLLAVKSLNASTLNAMGTSAREYAHDKLSVENMVENALGLIHEIKTSSIESN